MTRNLMMSIALSFVASFVTACVGAPEADVSAAAEGSALSSQAAIGGDQEDLSCPGAGTCAKADQACTTPGSQACNILATCRICYPDGWLTDNGPADDHVAAPKAEATRSEESLSCPAAGTCNRADQLCTTPGTQWCNILDQCLNCGWPY